MGGRFEEEEGGFYSFSEAAVRVGVYRCTWMALSVVSYGVFSFWFIFLLFQISPPFRLSLNILGRGSTGDFGLLKHLLLIGTELGLLAMVAFLTFLMPTLIMTWITALVFEYFFGRALLGERQGLVHQGRQIAKDIIWMAFKSVFVRGNIVAVIVFIFALVASGFLRGDVRSGAQVAAPG